jgi:hypothetical protein
MSAGAVSGAAFLQVDDFRQTFIDAQDGRQQIEVTEITPAEAGKPQTIMLLGTDQRLGADATWARSRGRTRSSSRAWTPTRRPSR